MSAAIAKALHGVMTKCGYVQKTGKNQFHGYRYAGEADLLDKLRPAMIEEGLLLLPSGKSINGPDEHGNVTVEIEYTLAHKDGDIWPEKLVAFGAGNDRAKNGSVGDKGVYKAITGANKYLLFKLFQIETGDDPEEQTEAPPPPPRRAPPPERDEAKEAFLAATHATIDSFGGTRADLLTWWNDPAQKTQRRAFGLTTDEVEALKAKVAAYQEPRQEAAE